MKRISSSSNTIVVLNILALCYCLQYIWRRCGSSRLGLALRPSLGSVCWVGKGTGWPEGRNCGLWPCNASAHPALQHPLWKVCKLEQSYSIWAKGLKRVVYTAHHIDTNPHWSTQICENLLLFLLTIISCDLSPPFTYRCSWIYHPKALLVNCQTPAIQSTNSNLQNIYVLFFGFHSPKANKCDIYFNGWCK